MLEKLKAKLLGAYKSITIWFNSVMAVTLVYFDQIKDLIPQAEQYLSAETYKLLAGATLIGNMLLRFKTKNDLADK